MTVINPNLGNSKHRAGHGLFSRFTTSLDEHEVAARMIAEKKRTAAVTALLADMNPDDTLLDLVGTGVQPVVEPTHGGMVGQCACGAPAHTIHEGEVSTWVHQAGYLLDFPHEPTVIRDVRVLAAQRI